MRAAGVEGGGGGGVAAIVNDNGGVVEEFVFGDRAGEEDFRALGVGREMRVRCVDDEGEIPGPRGEDAAKQGGCGIIGEARQGEHRHGRAGVGERGDGLESGARDGIRWRRCEQKAGVDAGDGQRTGRGKERG